MLQRHKFEVCRLHPRPQQEVVRHTRDPRLAKALRGAAALKVGHAGEKARHVDGREDELVAGDARRDGAVGRRHVHARGKEVVPFCGGGAEDHWGGGVSEVLGGERGEGDVRPP